eukprot:CAMPEP_0181296646 /NCGR_PEP_ID=MMETSP1101-20121128/4816_1 /TAXON_ID=46948 /ORGANISM="Rhodomonas abbreviata, Strain Caron Lab Isolate" /LENGTH=1106 /DNA_ID=CAMNT_0023401527 /DNA_START=256 /DNA_END=3577 /DNA_ORIENTATION=-
MESTAVAANEFPPEQRDKLNNGSEIKEGKSSLSLDGDSQDCVVVEPEAKDSAKIPVSSQPAKKRGRPSKIKEAPAAGCRGITSFLVTPPKKAKTDCALSPPTSEAATTPSDTGSKTVSPSTEVPSAKELDQKVLSMCGDAAVALDMEKANGNSETMDTDQNPAEKADAMDVDQAQGSVPSPEESSTTPLPPESEKSTTPVASEDFMKPEAPAAVVIDDNEPSAKPAADAKPASTPATVKKQAKAPKKNVVFDKAKQRERLQEELSLLSKMKFSIPYLMPSDQELSEDLNCAVVLDEEQPLPMKTRQVIARFVEGSTMSCSELSSALFEKAANKPDDSKDCLMRFENIVCLVAENVESRPSFVLSGDTHESIRKWDVRDIADIPAEFRTLLDANRKIQTAVRDRMVHVQKMIDENCAKEFGKLERALLVMKDKFVKLEEQERKQREKLDAKMEQEKKKLEAKLEKEKEKMEAERKRQEEKDERQKKKEEELRVKKEEKEKEKEVKKTEEKKAKAPEKPKDENVVKQASFMSNFFKKSSAPPAPKVAAPPSEQPLQEQASEAGAETEATPVPSKAHRNFHPWERPKNAEVAPFPWGPGEAEAPSGPSPEGTDLSSWLKELRKQPKRYRPRRPLREDGTEHQKMKLIQLNMKLPIVRTQLVDVDIDAPQKLVWDVEEDDSEKKLNEILEQSDPTPDGLYCWRGRTLQMLTEGGGWFDCRRPPFCGTFRKTSAHVTGKKPLAQDPELDYAYESDIDWESEVGEGEDLGSDIDADDDDEEMDEDDGGFVVQDGLMEEDADLTTVKRLKKLQQVVIYGETVTEEWVKMLSVQILDSMPLVLENDDNVEFDQDSDYFGEDVGNAKAPNLEAAILAVHKHPLACAFTYILPDSGHRYAGVVFLKGQGAEANKQANEGMLSGYLKDIPESKKAAIQKAAAEDVEMKPPPLPEPVAPPASSKAAADKGKAGAAENTKAAKTNVDIPDAQLLKLIKLVHGSSRSKVDLKRDFMELFPDVKAGRADKYLAHLCHKNQTGESKWVIPADRLTNPFMAEIAAEAWKTNTGASTPSAPVAAPPRAPVAAQQRIPAAAKQPEAKAAQISAFFRTMPSKPVQA